MMNEAFSVIFKHCEVEELLCRIFVRDFIFDSSKALFSYCKFRLPPVERRILNPRFTR